MTTSIHSIALYIKSCIENNEKISSHLKINLHSIEQIPFLNEKNKGESSYHFYHLLSDLIENVDIVKWSYFIDENIFNDEDLLTKAIEKSLKKRDLTLFKECLFYICKVNSKYQNNNINAQTEEQFRIIRNVFIKQLSNNYPYILAGDGSVDISDNFLDEFNQLRTIMHCLLGNEFSFNFNYSMYPISLQEICENKETWISNFKAEVVSLTKSPFDSSICYNNIFSKSINPNIDNCMSLRKASLKRNMTESSINITQKENIIIKVLIHVFENYRPASLINSAISTTDIKDIQGVFQNVINFKNIKLCKSCFKLKNLTISQLSFLYFQTFENMVSNIEQKKSPELYSINHDSKIKSEYQNIKFLFDLLLDDNKAIKIIASHNKFLILDKRFQKECESNSFLDVYKIKKEKNSFKFKTTENLILTIAFTQLLIKNKPQQKLNITSEFQSLIENSCDMTTDNFFSLRQEIFKNCEIEKFKNFINSICKKNIASEDLEYIFLDSHIKKNTVSGKKIKF